MIMSYRILRNEQRTDRDGKPEVFLQIEVSTADDLFIKGEWLSQNDADRVVKGLDSIDSHASEIEKRAMKIRPKQLADEEHVKALKLETAKLDAAKAVSEAEAHKHSVAQINASSELALENLRLETSKANRDAEKHKLDAEKHKLDASNVQLLIEKEKKVK
jgi:hypothetical protein